MKTKIKITEDLALTAGMSFCARCFDGSGELRDVVRFLFFEHEGVLCRAIESNIPEFHIEGVDTSIVPTIMRDPIVHPFVGLLSPHGYRTNTVRSALELYNRCFGSFRFELLPNQEIEVDEATVATTPRFIAENYGDEKIYTGQHGYHYSHGCTINLPKKKYKHRIGVELEVEATSETNLQKIRKFESNWFFMERDGSLNDNGVEFVTIPLLPSDAKNPIFWGPLCAALAPKARSWDSGRCGLHIHIGREILGATAEEKSATVGKLLYLYHHYLKHTQLNTSIFGREKGYHDVECKSGLAKAVDILGPKILKKKAMCEAIDKELKDISSEERYFDVNILNSHTIEFRRGKGSLRPARIAAVVEYCELLCIYARNVKWEKISYEHFESYLKSKISPDGPLSEIMSEKPLF
jgi:hypothetical protein